MRVRRLLEQLTSLVEGRPNGPLYAALVALRPKIAAAAQKIYDDWDQNDDGEDEMCGTGGVCDEIASAIHGIIGDIDGTEVEEGGHDGDDHAWLIIKKDRERYAVDIPPDVYERGGGYSWQKIPGVRFRPEHIAIDPI